VGCANETSESKVDGRRLTLARASGAVPSELVFAIGLVFGFAVDYRIVVWFQKAQAFGSRPKMTPRRLSGALALHAQKDR